MPENKASQDPIAEVRKSILNAQVEGDWKQDPAEKFKRLTKAQPEVEPSQGEVRQPGKDDTKPLDPETVDDFEGTSPMSAMAKPPIPERKNIFQRIGHLFAKKEPQILPTAAKTEPKFEEDHVFGDSSKKVLP